MDAFSVIDRPFKVVRVTSKGYLISTSVVDDISDPTSVQSERQHSLTCDDISIRKMVRTLIIEPRTTRKGLQNDLEAACISVTETTIGNTLYNQSHCGCSFLSM